MRDRTFPLDMIEDAVPSNSTVRADGYSGRGMYGNTCAAIMFDDMPDALRFFAQLGVDTADQVDTIGGQEPGDAVRDLASSARIDSMGRGVVVYFSGWTFA